MASSIRGLLKVRHFPVKLVGDDINKASNHEHDSSRVTELRKVKPKMTVSRIH